MNHKQKKPLSAFQQHQPHAMRKPLIMSAVSAVLLTISGLTGAQIKNPGFENRFNDWNETDPAAVSSDRRSGSRSAKISGSNGRLTQDVAIEANSNYVLTAYVRGSGRVGVKIGGQTVDERVSRSSSWEKLEVAFNSGSNTSTNVFAAYYDREGRFDDFKLEKVSSSNPDAGDTTGGDSNCNGQSVMAVSNASDNGTNDGNGPNNAVDGNMGSRWSSQGNGKALTLTLGNMSSVRDVKIAWYKGDQRAAYFDIQTSIDNSKWNTVYAGGQSFRNSGFETYNVTDSEAKYVRIVGYGNTSNNWNSILEVEVLGCQAQMNDGGGDTGGGDTGGDTGGDNTTLDPTLPPSGNFELIDWNISVPTDTDNNGKADTIKEIPLSQGYTDPKFFYTANDGGMVFKVPVKGFKTSTNTKYTRVELREMLRRGNTQFSTKGVGKNNWVFGSAPSADRQAAGGVDGKLTGTLAVNHVTTTGDAGQVGRVIVAQIHANDDEPIRLYYRKLPNNRKGSIYFAHESRNESSDRYYEMIGTRSRSQPDPADGIALGEKWSYEIEVIGNTLKVTIIRDGKPNLIETVNMNGSGYDVGGQYMYFKAGAYIQDNTGRDDDYAQVTYYALDNTH